MIWDMLRGSFLLEPSLRDLEVGSQPWFEGQLRIIRSRPLVRASYDRWYNLMLEDVRTGTCSANQILEIGSGAGYVKLLDPSVIASDIVPGKADLVLDAQALPFADESLRGILCTHVLHHIPNVELFFAEARRTLALNGVLAMIDVAHTALARFLFGHFHPEDYDASAKDWALNPERPCGGANQALSWMVFVRDRERFERLFPELRVECIELLPWLGYLAGGGVTRRNLIPKGVARILLGIDDRTAFTRGIFGLHWHIRIRKVVA